MTKAEVVTDRKNRVILGGCPEPVGTHAVLANFLKINHRGLYRRTQFVWAIALKNQRFFEVVWVIGGFWVDVNGQKLFAGWNVPTTLTVDDHAANIFSHL